MWKNQGQARNTSQQISLKLWPRKRSYKQIQPSDHEAGLGQTEKLVHSSLSRPQLVTDMAVEHLWMLPEEVQELYMYIVYPTKSQKNTLSLQFNRDIERAHCFAVLSLTRSLWKYLQAGRRHLIHATLVNAVHFHKEQIHAALSAQPDCRGCEDWSQVAKSRCAAVMLSGALDGSERNPASSSNLEAAN